MLVILQSLLFVSILLLSQMLVWLKYCIIILGVQFVQMGGIFWMLMLYVTSWDTTGLFPPILDLLMVSLVLVISGLVVSAVMGLRCQLMSALWRDFGEQINVLMNMTWLSNVQVYTYMKVDIVKSCFCWIYYIHLCVCVLCTYVCLYVYVCVSVSVSLCVCVYVYLCCMYIVLMMYIIIIH